MIVKGYAMKRIKKEKKIYLIFMIFFFSLFNVMISLCDLLISYNQWDGANKFIELFGEEKEDFFQIEKYDSLEKKDFYNKNLVELTKEDIDQINSLVNSNGILVYKIKGKDKVNKDIYEYNLYVDYRTTSITLEGLLGDKYATTTGFREYKLTDDKTVILIEVVSETGEVQTYKINVIKEYPSTNTSTKQMSLSSNNYLQTLKIEGYEIEFDKDKLEYEITVGSDVTSLDITAIAQLSSANVRIYGNDNFKEGENIVTIVVTAEDGSEKTYTIKVNKESAKKVDADDNDDQTEEDNGNVEKTIIIILIILVVIGLLYLIFKKDDDTPKTNKEQNK